MNTTKYIYKPFYPLCILIVISALGSCTGPTPEPVIYTAPKQEVELCDKDEIQHSKLLTVEQAHGLLNQEEYLFIEVSKESEYNKGHIPNALQVWRPDFRTKEDGPVGGMRCSAKEFVTFLQNLGYKETSTLIVYDTKGSCDALRLAWVFEYYGFDKYKVINGGKKAWTIAKYPLSIEQRKPKKNTDYVYIGKENQNILAEHEHILLAIQDTNTIIVDTRETYEHRGQCFVHQDKVMAHKKGAYDRGCIPTSVHLNWSTLSDLSHDHRIKCRKDLKYDLAKKGITKDKNIIVYCQSGSRSSHTAFVLKEILEYPNVKNYDGSWIEWSYLADQNDMPIHKHTSPNDFENEKKRLSSSLNKGYLD